MTVVIEAGVKVSLVVGGNFVDVSPMGVAINGTTVLINSGGSPASGSGANPTSPKDAEDAKPDEPEEADDAKTGKVSLREHPKRKRPT